ncbi:Hemolysin, contains CBS domains [Halorubrum aquaticum]|uniref:Hemolysin, contains CBS domains n=1 Tax=Halorubrum aquaticum TaxID=387340 RepID=A0A1I3BPY0_9EURY|nr:hemolysin family protein [Halorubrum aquaticum]SFH63979.1 Hemolysin, contains CBS domains [Halorubrum aquaticum]
MVDFVASGSRLLLALVLVVLNGFFVASEFAFVRIRSTSVEQLVEEGRAGAETLQDVMANLDNYLAVTQLGITLASLGLGWAGEPAVAALIEPVLEPLLPANLIHLVAFAVGFGFITFLHVVFGELAPKTIAIAEAERLSLFVAPPMKLCYLLFYPGLVVFNGTANAFTSLIGIPPASETDETLDEREIRRVLARAGEAGHVADAEVEMIDRVFEADDTPVTEVMVPGPDVVSVPTDASLSELRETIREAGHTRYPVTSGDGGEVVGFVDVKDVLTASDPDGDGTATAGDLAREVVLVPETTTVAELLVRFQDEHQQMAVVIDEWGAFEGLATIEDAVEAVVGDLRDDFDLHEPSIRRSGDDGYEIDGGVSLSAVNDALGVEFESAEFDTLGGLVLDRLGRPPEAGDVVSEDGYTIEVLAVDGARVSTVRIRQDDEESDGT